MASRPVATVPSSAARLFSGCPSPSTMALDIHLAMAAVAATRQQQPRSSDPPKSWPRAFASFTSPPAEPPRQYLHHRRAADRFTPPHFPPSPARPILFANTAAKSGLLTLRLVTCIPPPSISKETVFGMRLRQYDRTAPRHSFRSRPRRRYAPIRDRFTQPLILHFTIFTSDNGPSMMGVSARALAALFTGASATYSDGQAYRNTAKGST